VVGRETVSGSVALRKFQADGFLLTRVYVTYVLVLLSSTVVSLCIINRLLFLMAAECLLWRTTESVCVYSVDGFPS